MTDKNSQSENPLTPETINFSVDAGIINRLGRELVGRAETAVSELIKNAYDADARLVKLNFIESISVGGTLIIDDDGSGMTRDDLAKGFMKLSSTAKIHEPLSPKFGRHRAGRKGIGRFATQFLGENLTIITQTEDSQNAIKLTINWNEYLMDTELSSVSNTVEMVPKEKEHGTILKIENLRQSWSDAQIRRVFRYVSDLLQPSFLSQKSEEMRIAQQNDESFLVECIRTENGLESTIVDINKTLFTNALAEIEGFVDSEHRAFASVINTGFEINDEDIPISANAKSTDSHSDYRLLKDIHFKAYYFIYARHEYYRNGISKLELNNIENIAETSSGIRVYRNGFRVLPYGEIGDDWLRLDRRRTPIEIAFDEENVKFNIPHTNKNFFGFVEVIDKEGVLFEETASREGLIENEALEELKDFVRKAIIVGIRRLSPFIYVEKEKRESARSERKTIKEKVQDIQSKIEEFTSSTDADSESQSSSNTADAIEVKAMLDDLNVDLKEILDELAMLRILATLGITIGEFTHEIIQFPVFFHSKLKSMLLTETDAEKRESLEQVVEKINHLDTYTSYFNDAVSRNAKRDLEFIEMRRVIKPFMESIKWDFEHEGITVEDDIQGYDLFTCPMHPSEWHSILLNLYTNSKKALRRAKPKVKKIKIVSGKDDKCVFLEFHDNGDGIPDEHRLRIFDAFFTTSTPAGSNAIASDHMVGSGLGLKILKDIISEYKGEIYVAEPTDEYNTCIKIEIPKASDEQIENLEM